ncbi:pigment epithelium-derived factor [Chanos chanos]|uniref:Pigment epithelium-derived factor n=1 Tax=Chanos chanos TaxID=29144 RepID=A0A6J2WX75_CHACN|nr:pigment epithelium-derived factor [Chanos chanos]
MRCITLLFGFWGLLHCHAQLSDTGVEEGTADEEFVDLFTTPRTKMAAATSDFGYNLFRQLAAQDPQTSVFLSPLSISAALTQLSMGASERAQKLLYRALRYHTLQDSRLHDTLKDLIFSLQTPAKGFTSAARVLLSRRLRSNLEFLTAVETQYGTRPQLLMGGSRDLKTVNEWFKQQTAGKVDRVLSTPPPRNGGVALVGAAHFKGKWATSFSQANRMEPFQTDGGASTQVVMIQQKHYPIKMGIDSDLSCTIAQVPMEDGVSMYFFLPDEVTKNLTHIEETLTAEFVQDLSMTLHTVQADLMLPLLKLSSSTDLLPLFSGLGLTDWLADPDLVKITNQAAKLSTVRHKAIIETAAGGASSSSDSQAANQFVFHVDRPFLFLVRDEVSGALLFIGKVLNPQDLKK